jgi:choice-of-anchor B domain-containing protein
LGLVAHLASASFAQGSRTVTLLGRFNPYSGYAHVGGYVDKEGGEYALIGTRNGTSIVDVTDPTNPVEVAFISGPASAWREIQTYSTYAYVVTEGGGGVQIIDLSNLPNSASLANVYRATVNNAHTLSIDRDNGIAYVNGATQTPSDSRGGMNILDLSDPANPARLGVYNTRYVHDSYVRNNIAYTAEINNRQFAIVDVSDPRSPRVLAQKTYPGAFTHNVSLTDDGQYLLTTDETVNPGGRMRVWDISNLGNIVQVGDYSTHPQATIHNVHVLGDFAFAAYYAEGLRVIDITDPTLPVEAGYYDTHPEWVTGFRGAWGCYPYLPSGNILISDIETGLWIFSFDGTYAGRARGLVKDGRSQQPISGATLTLQGNNVPVTTNAQGAYGIGYMPGTYRLTISKPGYRSFETNVTLVSGETVGLNVDLMP